MQIQHIRIIDSDQKKIAHLQELGLEDLTVPEIYRLGINVLVQLSENNNLSEFAGQYEVQGKVNNVINW